MYKNILIPLDGSENAEYALEQLKKIGTPDKFDRIIVLRVFVPLIIDVRDYIGAEMARQTEEKLKESVDRYIKDTAAKLRNEGFPVEGMVETSNEPAAKILEIAEKENVELIIMTTHGKSGFRRWILGNVTHKVLTHTPCPILIAVKK